MAKPRGYEMLQLYFARALSDLARAQPNTNVKTFRKTLQALMRADDVEFQDARGKPVHGLTLLRNLLEERFSMTLRVAWDVGAEDPPLDEGDNDDLLEHEEDPVADAGDLDAGHARESHRRSTAVRVVSGVAGDLFSDPRFARFIRELDRLERVRRFVWIGYLAKERLPEIGFHSKEVNEVLDRSVDEGIITLGKVPNPKNPDYPATAVQLNHEHPIVLQLLDSTGRSDGFRPVAIRGEPASVTLVRERR